jgi:putative oxidoreductase
LKKLATHWVVLLILRVGVASLFLTACAPKILKPDQFIVAVDNYRFLPQFLVAPFALILPWVELTVGLLLLAGFWTRPAALVSSFTYLAFAVAVSTAVIRGLDIGCGCFSTEGAKPVTFWYILRDLSLLGVSIWLLIAGPGKGSVDAVISSRRAGV